MNCSSIRLNDDHAFSDNYVVSYLHVKPLQQQINVNITVYDFNLPSAVKPIAPAVHLSRTQSYKCVSVCGHYITSLLFLGVSSLNGFQ